MIVQRHLLLSKSLAELPQRVNAKKNSARRSAKVTETKPRIDGKAVQSEERETV
jgi:hypothetical protein